MKFAEMPYKRPDLEAVKKEFAELEKGLDSAQSGAEQFAVHERFYELTGHLQTLSQIAMIRHDGDMTDEYYAEEQKFWDASMPVLQNLQVSYLKKLYESPYRPFLEEKIGKVAFKNIELAMKSVDPKIIDLMVEENNLQERYNKILATAKIDWNGETLNLSLLNPYLHNVDRAVRLEAYKKQEAFFLAHADEFDEIYDKLVKNRTAQAQALGYDTYLPLGYCRMNRNSWGRSDVEAFRAQVKKDFVPFAEHLHEERARRLGIAFDDLRYYDEAVYFTQGNPNPIGTPAEILAAGRELYNRMSNETGRFMNFMCDNDLFDVEGRKTKKTGGYMTYIPDYKSPFIFANFNGTSMDADVITHECGHAFQGWLVADDPIREHADITMEIAETHSMSMEFFTEPYMELLFGNRAQDYREMHFEDAVTFIPYGTMVDEFQDIAYADPSLSPEDRRKVWLDLEKQYRPHMNYEGNEFFTRGGFWQKQHHIYDCPLYYIDYCIAGTNQLQYKAWMDRDYKAAWASYLKLCKLSASDFTPALLKAAGLDNPFEDGCLKAVVKKLEDRK